MANYVKTTFTSSCSLNLTVPKKFEMLVVCIYLLLGFTDIPQCRTVLQGPVLFTIYINNIGLSGRNCNLHLSADDTVVYSVAHSVDKALSDPHLTENLDCPPASIESG